jgi:hypothetical protein
VNKDRVGTIIFVISLCFIAFIYGVATVQFSLWPNAFLTDARNALLALIEIRQDEQQGKKLPSLEVIDDTFQTPTVIAHTDGEGPGDGYIFVDGGNNQLRSHCPVHGCVAWLIDRRGAIAHTWDIGPELIWGDLEQVAGMDLAENAYSVGAHLYEDGGLLVVYQGRNTFPYGLGVARFDRDSKLLWKKENFAHHWFTVDDNGFIYLPAFRAIQIPYPLGESHLQMSCPKGKLHEDVILVLDANGNEIDSIPIFDAFVKSGYSGAIFEHKHPDWGLPLVDSECDPTHINDVRVISAEQAADSALLNKGDLLISLRSTNAVAVLDGKTHLVKWLSTGRTVQQHSPRYIGNDQLLIFDNLGGNVGQGGSRIVKLDMLDDSVEVVFPGENTPGDIDFLSATAGHIALNADNTRALVSLTRQGRALEIDLASGEVLWEYINAHDITGLLPDRPADEKVFGRFATQTLAYVDKPAFELNGGKAGSR